MKGYSLNQISDLKIFIPVPAQDWEIIDLPISNTLHLWLRNESYITLKNLNGKKYSEVFDNPYTTSRCVKELFQILTSLTTLDGFRTLEFQVSAAKQKRTANNNLHPISCNKKVVSESPVEICHINTDGKNSIFSENQNGYVNLFDQAASIPAEFKDIFALLEIDESSDFLQLKSEEAVPKPWETEDRMLFIPTEHHDITWSDLDVSIRLGNVLRRLNVHKLGDLHQKNILEIKNIKNCGQKTVDELLEIIEKLSGGIENIAVAKNSIINRENEKFTVPEIIADFSIDEIKLSVRLKNILTELNVISLGDLVNFSIREIKNTENCGKKTVYELIELKDKLQDDDWAQEFVEEIRTRPIDEKSKIVVSTEVKDISPDCLALSNRLAKILKNLEIYTLGVLENFSIREINKTKNFGRKTREELKQLVTRIQQAEKPEDLIETKIEELPSELDLNGLLAFTNKFVGELPEREREIFISRFGGGADEKIPTLEELGENFSVTRERVRQIESKNIKLLQNRLNGISENALEKIKLASESAICPLNIRFLTYLTDNDYDLFIYPPNFYLYLIKKLAPEITVFLENQDLPNIVGNTAKLSKKIKSLLDEEVHFLMLAEVFERLHGCQNIADLTLNDFFEAIQGKNFIIENGDTPDVLLISTDKDKLTMTEMAWQILNNSDIPLLPEKIIEEAKALFGANTETPSKHSLANLPSYDCRFYLLDKRTIGLRQHFRLPEEKWAEVLNDFQQVLIDNQKPISTTDVVKNNLFEWTHETTPAELTEILREDSRFKDLGRFLFALTEWEIKEREPIKELVIRVLQETDEALIATEIGKRIQKYRSVSVTSMPTVLRNLAEIRSFEFGYYGLKTKGDYHAFFASDRKFLKRLVKTYSPIKFGDLCEKLGIDDNKKLVESMWHILRAIPEMRIEPAHLSPETIIKFSFWRLKPR